VTGLNYVCQHCLVHLGDLARYRSQPKQAETFYRQAIQIAPGNGQAYNQVSKFFCLTILSNSVTLTQVKNDFCQNFFLNISDSV
jgi:hypothetical protein